MYIKDGTVCFGKSDAHFVKKYGREIASQMALDFKSASDLPFINDTYQLAHFLSIERKELFFICRHINRNYRTIAIKKKNGANRTIHIPNQTLKAIQRIILTQILSKLPVSAYATAYQPGSRLYDNALPHCGKHYLLKLDITDFFGSILFNRIYNCAFGSQIFPRQIGAMLTTLCCLDDVLPQGASTSPILSNIVMKQFDDYIGQWCKQHDISYTRYCDDMTFSSEKPLYKVYTKVKTALECMAFDLNENKTVFITNANRQSVTGLTVNDKVAVSADYKRKLRQEVYYALKYGFENAILHAARKEFITYGKADTERYFHNLLGRVNFILQIEPHNTYFIEAKGSLLTKEFM